VLSFKKSDDFDDLWLKCPIFKETHSNNISTNGNISLVININVNNVNKVTQKCMKTTSYLNISNFMKSFQKINKSIAPVFIFILRIYTQYQVTNQ
jgi:hypothetical protein